MPSLRRAFVIALAALGLGAVAPLAAPEPPAAQANVVCDSPLPGPEDVVDVVGGAIGIGNPITDVCEAVTDPILGLPGKALDPLKDAAGSIGKGIFNQVTAWVAEGAVWLIGEVAVLSDKTTTPNLLSEGFVRQYRLMARIAAFMAALMLIFCVFEGIGRGDPGLLWRVFLINAPLAAIVTSAAYVVVQLLIATCDGMCLAISQSAGADSKEFFQGPIKALAAAGAGVGAVAGGGVPGPASAAGSATGAIAVPLFVGFIAAIVVAFAAFFVWIELLMRDAAIYVVALFMPLALAASIWPRWSSALTRTCELLVVIIFSKFVIVAIISLAASLLARNEGAVEHVLAAGAMLLLACFAPFVLFKLVPFAEGAVNSAFSRQSAIGGAVRSVEFANSMMMVHQLSRRNWDAASGGGGTGSQGGGTGGKGSRPGGGGPEGGGGAAAGGAVPVVVADEAARSAKGAGERLGDTGVSQEAESPGGSPAGGERGAGPGGESTPRPGGEGARSGGERGERAGSAGDGGNQSSPRPAAPEPREAGGGPAPGGARPPRPSAEKGDSPGKGGTA